MCASLCVCVRACVSTCARGCANRYVHICAWGCAPSTAFLEQKSLSQWGSAPAARGSLLLVPLPCSQGGGFSCGAAILTFGCSMGALPPCPIPSQVAGRGQRHFVPHSLLLVPPQTPSPRGRGRCRMFWTFGRTWRRPCPACGAPRCLTGEDSAPPSPSPSYLGAPAGGSCARCHPQPRVLQPRLEAGLCSELRWASSCSHPLVVCCHLVVSLRASVLCWKGRAAAARRPFTPRWRSQSGPVLPR